MPLLRSAYKRAYEYPNTRFVSLPTKLYQEKIVFGYIRNDYRSHVPAPLKYLCLSFYDQNVHMIFQDRRLVQFVSMQHRTAIYSQSFRFKDMMFHCSLCPRGWTRCDENKVMFYLETKHIPSNIKSISFLVTMECTQTETRYFNVQKKLIASRSRQILSKWNADLLSFDKIGNQTFSELEFICHVNVYEIQYENGAKWRQQLRNINDHSSLEWRITEAMRDDLTNYKVMHGPTCNIWSIKLYKDDNDDHYHLVICMDQSIATNDISMITAEVAISINDCKLYKLLNKSVIFGIQTHHQESLFLCKSIEDVSKISVDMNIKYKCHRGRGERIIRGSLANLFNHGI